ncbi:hypothetical protein MC7420_1154 [Coleofasciculus chthonoplastes PCC 7420]|uniref:Uncharacterized protein n=2 Tax=Coleofasciculus chthonoplastes TaxID=64178 RepID=B4VXD0_9CYAN|nr:hypothetical protein MC7420_1154 [Coleofasciculus chthonoplastes PCC 7420]
MSHACCRPGYASPEAAMKADRETVLYTIALYTGTGIYLIVCGFWGSNKTHAIIFNWALGYTGLPQPQCGKLTLTSIHLLTKLVEIAAP